MNKPKELKKHCDGCPNCGLGVCQIGHRINSPVYHCFKKPVQRISKKVRYIGEGWEDEFDKKYAMGIGRRWIFTKQEAVDIKDFIHQTIASETEWWKEANNELLAQFMTSYCKHGKKHNEDCIKCGRVKV